MPIKIKKRGQVRYLGRVTKDKVRREKIFGTKAEARKWEAAERARDWTTDTGSLTLLEVANKYMDHVIGRGSAEQTVFEKSLAFRRLFTRGAVVPEMDPAELTAGMALEHLQGVASERTGSAANNDRKNLIAFWHWAEKFVDGFPNTNPWLRVSRFPITKKPRYVPPEDDFWKVYEAADMQDRAILAVALYTAARRGEIWRLKVNDLDFERQTIRLGTRKRKGGSLEYNTLPMVDALKDDLLTWMRTRPLAHVNVFYCWHDEKGQIAKNKGLYGQPFKFRPRWLTDKCNQVGVKPFGMHSIRHLSASILYRAGVSTSVIQQVLRHQSPTTTNRYLHGLGLEETRKPLEEALSRPGKLIQLPKRRAAGE